MGRDSSEGWYIFRLLVLNLSKKKNYFYLYSVIPSCFLPSGLVWLGLFTLEYFTFGNRFSVCCRS